MEKKEERHSENFAPFVEPVMGEPVDVWDQINKYGTYEVQDTTETDNVFPLIGPLGAGVSGVLLPKIPDAVQKEADEAAAKKGELKE